MRFSCAAAASASAAATATAAGAVLRDCNPAALQLKYTANEPTYHAACIVEYRPRNRSNSHLTYCTTLRSIYRANAINRYTAYIPRHKAVHKSTPWLLPTILHADWSNRPRTAFRRWTQAGHQVAAIQVGRRRFVACPYHFLPAKRQAKADLSSGHSHDRTAFEAFAPDISEQPDPNLTDLFDTRNHGSQRLSARYQHTRHGVIPCLMS